MDISGATFEEHSFKISWDILHSVFYYFRYTPHDVITFLIRITQKCQYLKNEKRNFKNENAILLYLCHVIYTLTFI